MKKIVIILTICCLIIQRGYVRGLAPRSFGNDLNKDGQISSKIMQMMQTERYLRATYFLQQLGVKEGSKIVEIGFLGDTALAVAAAFMGAHYLGYELLEGTNDWNEDIKWKIRNMKGSYKLIQGAFSAEPNSVSRNLADNSVDVVVMRTGVLSDPAPVYFYPREVFREVLRVVKKDSKAILFVGTLGFWKWKVLGAQGERATAEQNMNSVLQEQQWKGKVLLKTKEDISYAGIILTNGTIYEIEFIGHSGADKVIGISV